MQKEEVIKSYAADRLQIGEIKSEYKETDNCSPSACPQRSVFSTKIKIKTSSDKNQTHSVATIADQSTVSNISVKIFNMILLSRTEQHIDIIPISEMRHDICLRFWTLLYCDMAQMFSSPGFKGCILAVLLFVFTHLVIIHITDDYFQKSYCLNILRKH